MDSPFYEFSMSEDATFYEFDSIGEEMTVCKQIKFSASQIPDFYWLALVDVLEDGSVSDSSRPRQGNVEKVLATVLQTMLAFFKRYPTASVAFSGSTDTRTRLYSVAIVRELNNARDMFMIQGYIDGVFEDYTPGRQYAGFAISLKSK